MTRCKPSYVWALSCLLLLGVQAKLQIQEDATNSQSRLRSLSLGMGCPEFLSSYYESNASDKQPFRSFTITKGSAYGYVAVHFSKLWLPKGASVILRGVEGYDRQDVTFNLTDAFRSGVKYEDVYAPPVLAKEFRIEFYRDQGPAKGKKIDFSDGGCHGFIVDWYHYVLVDSERNITPSREATCAQDNSEEAVCAYEQSSTRTSYLASQAVARLLIQKDVDKQAACTGWLLGSEGHLITNYHCVKNQDEASSTTVEFMADATKCSESCTEWGTCQGTVEAISTKLIQANEELDYALLLLQTDVDLPKKYGFLRLKTTQGHQGQEVYIPQHPMYYGKRISTLDDYGNHITIRDINATGCNSAGYSYNGDTQAGSSGSPVIDAQDHGVVALHHCGQSCANTGIPSVSIISDLKSNNVLPALAIDPGDNMNAEYFPDFHPREAVAAVNLTTWLKFDGAVHISSDGTSVGIDQFEFELREDAEIAIDVMSAEISDDGTYVDLNHDCQATYMDAIIFLFSKDNPKALLIKDDDNDNKGRSDGSVSARDPYLRTFLKNGTYVLAIASMPATSVDAYNGQSLVQDPPEIYSCVKSGKDGSYQIKFLGPEFLPPESMSFKRLPQSVTIPGTCDVPAEAICAF
ncbi:hypothetical protein Poli38472_007382 [Pythium oligandrum]|uniref:Serine protease n=1 Tax=Pythium oligandrum TaxID=41045 RepID=A0A8K1FH00_PYTOL|nr:hypothetical protein Poli38472_007382 [Pythium oligandrum]|eukprot:TMW59237.1 hypothetical protein Poli38472_007382 [Pythium oligandrum]